MDSAWPAEEAEERSLQEALLASCQDAAEEHILQQGLWQSLRPRYRSTSHLPVDVREQLDEIAPDLHGVAPDLHELLVKLGQKNPSLVRHITWTAGSTLKFQYLQACGRYDKAKSQEIWRSLPERDRRDLLGAFELGDGDRHKFFLTIAEEDRRMRSKLSEAATPARSGSSRDDWRDAAELEKVKRGFCLEGRQQTVQERGLNAGEEPLAEKPPDRSAEPLTREHSQTAAASRVLWSTHGLADRRRQLEALQRRSASPGRSQTDNVGGLSTEWKLDAEKQALQSVQQVPLLHRVAASLQRLNLQPGRLFHSLDKDGDGRLCFDEFALLLSSLEPGTTANELVDIFNIVDTNKDRLVDEAEFTSVLQTCILTS